MFAKLKSQFIKPIKSLIPAFINSIYFYGSLSKVLSKAFLVYKREGFTGLFRKASAMSKIGSLSKSAISMQTSPDLYGSLPERRAQGFNPLVSIIVPNYNHAAYLRERLDSVYNQTYKNIEVILLDDCSDDDSRQILQAYANQFPEITTLAFNEVNSGGVFNQWRKGLLAAKGDLIWIAESDDYCSLDMLEELIRFFKNDAVMLAFCRSDFVQGKPTNKVWSSEDFLADLKLNIWSTPFVKSAHWLVNNAWAIKNIVPNVSSAVFRNPGNIALLSDDTWRELRLCGDWVFYLNLIRGGLVAYSPLTTNFYRQHEQGTSISVQKEEVYYKEHEYVVTRLNELYNLSHGALQKQQQSVYMHWVSRKGDLLDDQFNNLYSLERGIKLAKKRLPNVMMVCVSLVGGGGETFPIMLINQLKLKGLSATLLNCKVSETVLGVRHMLDKSIPLLELTSLSLLEKVCDDMGIEIVHSHHAWVDMVMAKLLCDSSTKHVISMHGMYESMGQVQFNNLMPIIDRKVSRIVYTAEKNLTPFTSNFIEKKQFIKIDNALVKSVITPISRSSLGLQDNDFVVCLVSRAIPEKGWDEAIRSIIIANKEVSRKIHLVLIGDGPEYDRLKPLFKNDFIHFLGFRGNIRDYFAMADIGFLPSRFQGESFPLVLIDCLLSDKPFLGSNVGEIKNMLSTEIGLAGDVFDLDNGMIPIQNLAERIINLATNSDYYETLCKRVGAAALKFDINAMTDSYINVYKSVTDAKEVVNDD
ncbi:hypothetical protein C3Y98_06140 [Methylotenera oryzisoli]|uniref:Glycosyltransferase n=1 Tax=Methylotenera oryzisoli TaxID=2080758 RepID=A0A4Y9VRS6_9PROT|nr:glycosyltransferase [Methylotenera oryzisoli]TFW71664.1 hypothetical protein C3Y98_06140 [Methylotenera oryzisoli]